MAEQCGIHALNNALGFHCFGVEDMLHAADTFLFENPELGDRQQDHVAPEGDYSIEIMLMALRTKAMQDFGRLRWHMDDCRATELQDLEGCIGAVQNIDGRHWVALRRWGDSFLYLDSLQRQVRCPGEAELSDLLSTHPTYVIRNI